MLIGTILGVYGSIDIDEWLYSKRWFESIGAMKDGSGCLCDSSKEIYSEERGVSFIVCISILYYRILS